MLGHSKRTRHSPGRLSAFSTALFVCNVMLAIAMLFITVAEARRTSKWSVRLVAGTFNFPGNSNSAGQNALFEHPTSSATERSLLADTLYIAEQGNRCVRKLTLSTATPSAVTGWTCSATDPGAGSSFVGSTTQLRSLKRITYDPYNEQFLLATQSPECVFLTMSTSGTTAILMGALETCTDVEDSGSVANSRSSYAGGIVAVRANYYVVEGGVHLFSRVDVTGNSVTRLAGTGVVGCSMASPYNGHTTMTSGGTIASGPNGVYLSLYYRDVIKRADVETRQVYHVVGSCSASETQEGIGSDARLGDNHIVLSGWNPVTGTILLAANNDYIMEVDVYTHEGKFVQTTTGGSLNDGRFGLGGEWPYAGVTYRRELPTATPWGSYFTSYQHALVEIWPGELKAYYPLAGSGYDASGNGYHLTTYGTAITTVAFASDIGPRPRRALKLDGTANSHLEAPVDMWRNVHDFTICLEVQPTATNVRKGFFAVEVGSPTENRVSLYQDGAGNLKAEHFTAYVGSGAKTLSTVQSNHVCFSRIASIGSVFFDGQRLYDFGLTWAISRLPTKIVLGADLVSSTPSNILDGSIANVKVWNYGFTSAEISVEYLKTDYGIDDVDYDAYGTW